MTLKELKVGQSAIIDEVGSEGHLRQHFLDMGVIPQAEVTLVKLAPMGDPMELRLHGYELTLRLDDADKIKVHLIDKKENDISNNKGKKESEIKGNTDTRVSESGKKVDSTVDYRKHNHNLKEEHPGLGETKKGKDGKDRRDNYKVEKSNEPLTFALVGNQNCGKTTLFNQLTGSNQHVGNFPGVTVDRKSGEIKGKSNTLVTDLPGIYSLSPYTNEEIVSRQFIFNEKPKGIINIVDATNIERNLYLTMQLMELGVPMVLALNMMDEVRGNGGAIKINAMEKMLGIPVIPIVAAKNEGIGELIDHAIHVAKYNETPGRNDFCDANDHGGAVHRALHAVMHLIEDKAKKSDMPIRFAATKLIEGDERVQNKLNLSDNETATLNQIISQMEEERGIDRSAAIADMRFSFIEGLVESCVIKPKESKESVRSQRIDKILTGKYTAIPCFVAIIAIIFWLTFNVIGAWLQEMLETGVEWISDYVAQLMISANVNGALQSLIVDGILTGVGAVVSFLPIIVTLFFFLSLLEDTGYMARVAFVMDKPLRKIGLSGRSIVPMLIGFGCSVPAVMSSRTLPSERDRKLTILLIPFMSCTAKLPIYGFFINAFFPVWSGLIMVGLYFIGILVGIITAMISKKLVFKGEAVPFVMELPNYRMPGAKNVLQLLWEKAKDFLQKAFTVILLATIVIWFLQNFDIRMNMVEDASNSILAGLAGLVAPIFTPLGFGNWRCVTALITGFIAKESVVSTLTILYGSTEALAGTMSLAAALALLIFCLLYTPCIAAIAAIKRELGTRRAVATVLLQCIVAWVCAFAAYIIAGMVF